MTGESGTWPSQMGTGQDRKDRALSQPTEGSPPIRKYDGIFLIFKCHTVKYCGICVCFFADQLIILTKKQP